MKLLNYPYDRQAVQTAVIIAAASLYVARRITGNMIVVIPMATAMILAVISVLTTIFYRLMPLGRRPRRRRPHGNTADR